MWRVAQSEGLKALAWFLGAAAVAVVAVVVFATWRVFSDPGIDAAFAAVRDLPADADPSAVSVACADVEAAFRNLFDALIAGSSIAVTGTIAFAAIAALALAHNRGLVFAGAGAVGGAVIVAIVNLVPFPIAQARAVSRPLAIAFGLSPSGELGLPMSLAVPSMMCRSVRIGNPTRPERPGWPEMGG